MVSSPLSPSFSNYEFYTMRVYKKKILPSLPRGKSSERFNYSYEWFAFLFFSSLLLFSVTYTHVIFPVNFASFSIRQIPASLPPPNVEVLIRNVALIHLAIIRSRGFFSYPRKTIQSITTRFASCYADFNPTERQDKTHLIIHRQFSQRWYEIPNARDSFHLPFPLMQLALF